MMIFFPSSDLSIAKCKHDLADAFNSKWLIVHHYNQFKCEGQSYNTLWSNPVCVNKIMDQANVHLFILKLTLWLNTMSTKHWKEAKEATTSHVHMKI